MFLNCHEWVQIFNLRILISLVHMNICSILKLAFFLKKPLKNASLQVHHNSKIVPLYLYSQNLRVRTWIFTNKPKQVLT